MLRNDHFNQVIVPVIKQCITQLLGDVGANLTAADSESPLNPALALYFDPLSKALENPEAKGVMEIYTKQMHEVLAHDSPHVAVNELAKEYIAPLSKEENYEMICNELKKRGIDVKKLELQIAGLVLGEFLNVCADKTVGNNYASINDLNSSLGFNEVRCLSGNIQNCFKAIQQSLLASDANVTNQQIANLKTYLRESKLSFDLRGYIDVLNQLYDGLKNLCSKKSMSGPSNTLILNSITKVYYSILDFLIQEFGTIEELGMSRLEFYRLSFIFLGLYNEKDPDCVRMQRLLLLINDICKLKITEQKLPPEYLSFQYAIMPQHAAFIRMIDTSMNQICARQIQSLNCREMQDFLILISKLKSSAPRDQIRGLDYDVVRKIESKKSFISTKAKPSIPESAKPSKKVTPVKILPVVISRDDSPPRKSSPIRERLSGSDLESTSSDDLKQLSLQSSSALFTRSKPKFKPMESIPEDGVNVNQGVRKTPYRPRSRPVERSRNDNVVATDALAIKNNSNENKDSIFVNDTPKVSGMRRNTKSYASLNLASLEDTDPSTNNNPQP